MTKDRDTTQIALLLLRALALVKKTVDLTLLQDETKQRAVLRALHSLLDGGTADHVIPGDKAGKALRADIKKFSDRVSMAIRYPGLESISRFDDYTFSDIEAILSVVQEVIILFVTENADVLDSFKSCHLRRVLKNLAHIPEWDMSEAIKPVVINIVVAMPDVQIERAIDIHGRDVDGIETITLTKRKAINDEKRAFGHVILSQADEYYVKKPEHRPWPSVTSKNVSKTFPVQ